MLQKRLICLLLVTILLSTLLPVYAVAAPSDETELANRLNAAGLFMGTSKGFELERTFSRVEAAVMLVRMLGKEEQALSEYNSRGKQAANPFTDVDAWADPYLDYLYQNKLVQGISKDLYGSKMQTLAKDYCTLMLRALGYDDTAKDFQWNTAVVFAAHKGIIQASTVDSYEKDTFRRGDCVVITYQTLQTHIKNSKNSMLDKLIQDGSIQEDNRAVLTGSVVENAAKVSVYTPQDIYENDRYIAYSNEEMYRGGVTLVDKQQQQTYKLTGFTCRMLTLTPNYLVCNIWNISGETVVKVVDLATVTVTQSIALPTSSYTLLDKYLVYTDAHGVNKMRFLGAPTAAISANTYFAQHPSTSMVPVKNAKGELRDAANAGRFLASRVHDYTVTADETIYYTTQFDAEKQNQLIQRDAITGMETVLAQNVIRFVLAGNKIYYQVTVGNEKFIDGSIVFSTYLPVEEMALDNTDRKKTVPVNGVLRGYVKGRLCSTTMMVIFASVRKSEQRLVFVNTPTSSQPMKDLDIGQVTTKDWPDDEKFTTYTLDKIPKITPAAGSIQRLPSTEEMKYTGNFRINKLALLKQYPTGYNACVQMVSDSFLLTTSGDTKIISTVDGKSWEEPLQSLSQDIGKFSYVLIPIYRAMLFVLDTQNQIVGCLDLSTLPVVEETSVLH